MTSLDEFLGNQPTDDAEDREPRHYKAQRGPAIYPLFPNVSQVFHLLGQGSLQEGPELRTSVPASYEANDRQPS
jgi:hypothetical protein